MAEVVMTLSDGRRLSAKASPQGAPHAPFDWPAVETKAHVLADEHAGPDAVDRFIAAAHSWATVNEPVRPVVAGALADTPAHTASSLT